MTKTIENLFYWLAYATDVFFILLFLLLYKKNQNFYPIWILLPYTIINLIINKLYELFPLKTGFILYACFTLIEYTFFTLFILSFIKNTFSRKLVFGLSIIFTLFLPFYHINATQSFIDSIPIGIETILILIFSFCYFYEQINDIENGYLYNRYHFWAITGMIFYLAGSFFMYIFTDYLVDVRAIQPYWFLIYIFYVLKNILFIISLLQYTKQYKLLQKKPFL